MADLNTFACTGNLGGDAESKDVNGRLKARYRIAISGRKEDSTTWMTCDHWDVSPNLLPLLTKGKKVALSGRLEENGWVGQDGKPKSALIFVVNNLTLLGGKDQPAAQERGPGLVQGAPKKPKWEKDSDATPF
jgi:single-strand DNA-binding protein